jgi:hypothetical protein
MLWVRVLVYFELRQTRKNHPSRLDGEMGRRARGDFRIKLTVDILGRFISCLSRTVKEFGRIIVFPGMKRHFFKNRETEVCFGLPFLAVLILVRGRVTF